LRTKVTEVSHKGTSSLVEWVDDNGNLNRAIVPTDEVVLEDGEAFVNSPEEGAPYGEAWEDLIRAKLGPKGIADLLRQRGIWSYDDFLRNSAVVTSVFNEACSINLQAFREAVRLRQETVITQEERED
jgi:hypothetical protein